VTKARYDIPVEPKAGKVGTISVVVFGVVAILAVFVAAYMWTVADTRLAAAIGVASIAIPVTVGYFVSEFVHQRAGALWFVVAAAMMIGGFGGWAYLENDAFQDRMDLIAPGFRDQIDVETDEVPDVKQTESGDEPIPGEPQGESESPS